jgi:uncharacterized protein (DUF1697 family)
MADLREALEALGLGRVQTYIQSGNILFESSEDETIMRQRIEQEIEKVFGLSIKVIIRTSEELKKIVKNCPFLWLKAPIEPLWAGFGQWVTVQRDCVIMDIGIRLYNHAESYLKDCGCKGIEFETHPKRSRMFERLGFTIVGTNRCA